MLESRSEPLEVGRLIARPGERVRTFLSVGELADGTPVRVPIVLMRGTAPGPVLYVQAISDGDELNGIGVLHRFFRELDVEALRGGIIAVPLVNFHAFHARQAHNPIDGKKMNRCFPGRADGTPSERIAHRLFRCAVLRADLCIDLHQGGVRPMIDEVRVRVASDHPQHHACFELARVFGIGYILDEQGPPGQLAQVAPDQGIPTIDPELGGCHGWDERSIEKGLRGLWNVLYHYGFIEGEPTLPEVQYVVREFVAVRPKRGGFVTFDVDLYDHVTQGEPIGVVHNVFGDPIETLLAPATGIVWSRSLYPTAATGEAILTLGVHPTVLS